jgi:hypothetical protein
VCGFAVAFVFAFPPKDFSVLQGSFKSCFLAQTFIASSSSFRSSDSHFYQSAFISRKSAENFGVAALRRVSAPSVVIFWSFRVVSAFPFKSNRHSIRQNALADLPGFPKTVTIHYSHTQITMHP